MNLDSILKIFSPLLMLGTAISQIVIDHIWHDKRTKKYRRTKRVLVSLLVIMTFFTIFIVYQSEKDNVQLKNSLKNIEKASNDAKSDRIKLIEKNQELQKSVENLRLDNAVIARQSEKLELEAKNERATLEKKIDSLETKFEPFINIAKNSYPELNTDDALKKLLDDVNFLKKKTDNLEKADKQIALQGVYRPLNIRIKNSIISTLKNINIEQDKNITIELSCEMGSQSRNLVTKELKEIFDSANFQTKGPNMTLSALTGQGPPPKVTIIFNSEDVALAKNLFNALKIFLKTNFTGIKNEEYETGKIKISIYGDPIFSQDGTVLLK